MSIDINDTLRANQRDRVIRRRLPLWEPEPSKQQTLMELYRYWESLRPTGLIPSRKDFDVLRLRSVMGTTCVIEVDGRAPDDFFVRLYGTALTLPDNMNNRRLADMHCSSNYRAMLEQDYAAARDIGVPLYHEVAAMIDYITHSYARLILPFSSDARTVNQLVVSSVRQDLPDLIKLLY